SRSVPHDVPDASYDNFLQFQTLEGSNIEDGGTTVDGAIGAYGSGIGEMANEAKRYLDKSSEGLGEVRIKQKPQENGEMTNEAKRYLDQSSEGLGEVFPSEAGE
ncbi:hypothetical protein Tco_1488269, partial [Tanacetum coccineum]